MAIPSLLTVGGNSVYAPLQDVKSSDGAVSARSAGVPASVDHTGQAVGVYYLPGLMNIGSGSDEVLSKFSEQVLDQRIASTSNFARWDSQHDMLASVQQMLGAETGTEATDTLSRFFADWAGLAASPDSQEAAEQLVASSNDVVTMLRGQRTMLEESSTAVAGTVYEALDTLNDKLQALVQVNEKIAQPENVQYRSDLVAERNEIIQAISEKLDIETRLNGLGQLQVATKSGFTLVEGTTAYTLQLSEPSATQQLIPGSMFDGTVTFEGTSSREMVFEVAHGGAVGTGEVGLRVSLDGRRSWLSNEDGTQMMFPVAEDGTVATVQGVSMTINANAGLLATGDSFVVVPKQHITGFTPSGRVNLTPQTFFDGSSNELRITGGSLAGLMEMRDDKLANYAEKLDTLASTLISQVNQIHAQGASTVSQDTMVATNAVRDASVPLVQKSAGLAFGEEVSSGKMTVFAVNTETGKSAPTTAYGILEFADVAPYVRDFDPTVHSLESVKDAVNASLGQFGTATIEDGVLNITAAENHILLFGEDSSGLFAALGMNGFFTGTSAQDISIAERIQENSAAVNAGAVNSAGVLSAQSADTARSVAALQNASFKFSIPGEITTNQSVSEFYSALYTQAENDVATITYKSQMNEALLLDLSRYNDTMTDNNLDAGISEMTRSQHSYKAAAKLIISAEEMMQVISGMPN
ncbi:MAG: hypothetical protein MI749_05840 [Desulfovibrionales bacterium]|nr:hypothetical protein [Desulfovibrionales bacterium]